MSVNLLTGHKATNHISAADEAAFMSAYVSGGNYVVADAQEITLTADTSAGSLSVDAFVALFSGRKVVVSGASANYTKPSSGTTYRHVSAGLLYTKNTNNDDLEDCVFAVYTSASDRASQSTAAGDPTGAPATTEIDAATTEAYFELFDLVVSGSAVVKQSAVYHTSETISGISEKISTLQTDLTQSNNRITSCVNAQTAETTARQTADSGLSSRISALESWRNAENSTDYKLVKVFAPYHVGYEGIDYVICKVNSTSYKTMWRYDTATDDYELYYYILTLNSAGTSATVQFFYLGLSAKIYSTSGGGATVLGSIKAVL